MTTSLDRLPRPKDQRRARETGRPTSVRRTREVADAALAAVTLVAVVVGLPVLLTAVGGPPWPAHLPSLSEIGVALMRPDDGQLLVAALQASRGPAGPCSR
jgi:hypothetical protein